MQIRGTMVRVGKVWAVECPALCARTEGKSKPDALVMMKDWVRAMLDDEAYEFDIAMVGRDEFAMTFADPRRVLALALRQHRELAGKTMQDVADELKLASRSSVKQVESGKNEISLSKLIDMLAVFGIGVEIRFHERSHPDASPKAPASAQRAEAQPKTKAKAAQPRATDSAA